MRARTEKLGIAIRNYKGCRKALFASIACGALAITNAAANPTGGEVVAGQGEISAPAANTVEVNQASKTLILNWDSFDIAKDEVTRFKQPDALSLAVNRIGSADPSQILGTLTANGRIILINPNGLLFGDTARINVGSLVATTHDLGNDDILAGNLNFNVSGNPLATVENYGALSASSGSIAFVAPGVSNAGIVTARLGTVALAGASKFTLDFEGDSLISFPVDAEVVSRAVGSDGKPVEALVSNKGTIEGSTVVLSARSAGDVIANAINIEGTVIARTARRDGDDIVLGGYEDRLAHGRAVSRIDPAFIEVSDTEKAPRSTEQGGAIAVDGGTHGIVSVTGSLDASGGTGGKINVSGNTIYADGVVAANGTDGAGGAIFINSGWLSVGGAVAANGASSGGVIDIDTGNLSLTGSIEATGTAGDGGSVDIEVARRSLEFNGASIDVSGARGGSIRSVAGQQITSSATYTAIGRSGSGGTIDVSASATKLLSATMNASGYTAGGRIRLGGEFRGGKSLPDDELPNGRTTVASDGTKLLVDALGPSGAGGEVIVWSDVETVFLGSIFARPGSVAGAGGFVEISSAELLQYAGTVETGIGERQGTVLFDPKNINIVDVVASGIQVQLVLGYNSQVAVDLENEDRFGSSVALDGNRLVVGVKGDDGFGVASTEVTTGAVYLYSFADSALSGPILQGIVGAGYTGGRNIDVSEYLGLGESFGASVSLDGNRLAVGSPSDTGFGSASGSNAGAVYLFTFGAADFGQGSLKGILGSGYAPTPSLPSNLDLQSLLQAGDQFGYAVSMDGNRLAVGTPGDDGQGATSAGAVHLFTFADSSLSSPTHVGSIGVGYTGQRSLDLDELNTSQDVLLFDNRWFGASVSLDGDHLAVGIPNGGFFPTCTGFSPCVKVALFSFEDETFSNPSLSWKLSFGSLDDPGWGTSVALDGNLLAFGAPYRCAFGHPGCTGTYIHLASFDLSFTSAIETASIGLSFSGGYEGPNEYNIAKLRRGENGFGFEEGFGTALALDGGRLAVGQASWGQDLGRVALFTLDNSASPTDVTFGSSPGSNVTISKNAMLELLADGQSVILQANNDITLSVDLVVNRLLGGDLTLEAGRSILLNGSITTGNGDLTLIANSPDADSAHRDEGAAKIEMKAGTAIDAGTGTLSIEIKNGAGPALADANISLEKISAGTIVVSTLGGAGKDIRLRGEIQAQGSASFRANNNIFVGGQFGCVFACANSDVLLEAGNGVYVSADILSGGGDITILANRTLADGVIDAYRDSGTARISVDPGTTIDAGSGDAFFRIGDGAGLTHRNADDITLQKIFASSIFVDNMGGTGRDIILNDTIKWGSGFFSAFEANNDIKVNADVSSSCIFCTGEDVLLRAGRSVKLAGSIDTVGGDLTIMANSHVASDAHRDSGPAEILMEAGTHIRAGIGHVQLTLGTGESLSCQNTTGAGTCLRLTHRDSGNIHLREVSGRSILVENLGPSERDIIVAGELWLAPRDANITADSSIVVATRGNFINLAGAAALDPSRGRFLIYAKDHIGSNFGGLAVLALFSRSYDAFDPDGRLNRIPSTGNFAVFEAARPRGRALRELPLGITPYLAPIFDDLEIVLERRLDTVRRQSTMDLESVPELLAWEGAQTNGIALEELSFKLAPYAVLAEAAYDDDSPDFDRKTLLGFTKIAQIDSLNPIGVSYAIWERDGNALVVFEGTDPPLQDVSSIPQWVLNIGSVWLNTEPTRLDESLAAVNSLIERYGNTNVSCLGHSLGGTLCAYASGLTGINGITFDPMQYDYTKIMNPDAIRTGEASILAIRMQDDPFALDSHDFGGPIETRRLGQEFTVPNRSPLGRCTSFECHSMRYLSDTLAVYARRFRRTSTAEGTPTQ